jgi:hypothetical protein
VVLSLATSRSPELFLFLHLDFTISLILTLLNTLAAESSRLSSLHIRVDLAS